MIKRIVSRLCYVCCCIISARPPSHPSLLTSQRWLYERDFKHWQARLLFPRSATAFWKRNLVSTAVIFSLATEKRNKKEWYPSFSSSHTYDRIEFVMKYAVVSCTALMKERGKSSGPLGSRCFLNLSLARSFHLVNGVSVIVGSKVGGRGTMVQFPWRASNWPPPPHSVPILTPANLFATVLFLPIWILSDETAGTDLILECGENKEYRSVAEIFSC